MDKGIIDPLLTIAVLMHLVKGGDLLLRDHQKEWLQDHFETFTLRLDDIQPILWFGALSRPRPAAVWSVISAAFAIAAPAPMQGGALLFLHLLWFWSAENLFGGGVFLRIALGVGLLVAIPVSVVCLWKLCPRLVRKLVGGGRVAPFFGRLLVLYLLSVILLAAFLGASTVAKDIPLAQVLLAAVWPFFLPVHVLNTAGLLLVTLLFALLIARLVLAVLGGICWRIVEYNRGVFAAALLIVTVALGTYRVMTTGQ